MNTTRVEMMSTNCLFINYTSCTMLYGGYVHVVDLQEVSWGSYYHNLATIQSLHVHVYTKLMMWLGYTKHSYCHHITI